MIYGFKIHGRTFFELASAALLIILPAGLTAECLRAQDCDLNAAFARVNGLLAEKDYDDAGKALDQVRACPFDSTLEKFQLGWLYGRARRFDTALTIFSALPEDVPDRLTHDYAIALSKFELAQYQGVIDILKSSRSSGISDAKSSNLMAVAYSKLGMYREAYAVLTEQIQKDSADLNFYLNLVTVCAEGGDFARAADTAAEARRVFPDSPDVLIAQGAAETLLGHLDRAYEAFSAGARVAPTRADVRFFLALVDYKQGKFPEAIDILRIAAKDGITDADLEYLGAECLLKMDPTNTTGALEKLDRAIALDPNSVSARSLRGKLLFESGRLQPALTDLEFAIHRDPDSRATLYNLARVYRALGRTTEAQLLFRQVRTQATGTLNEFSDKRLNETLTERAAQQ